MEGQQAVDLSSCLEEEDVAEKEKRPCLLSQLALSILPRVLLSCLILCRSCLGAVADVSPSVQWPFCAQKGVLHSTPSHPLPLYLSISKLG